MIIYKLFDGSIVDDYDMKKAFYILFGRHPEDVPGSYIRFINGCFRTSIAKYYKPTVERLIRDGFKLRAIKLYRDEHDCSLAKAKEAIEKMQKEMEESAS